jgi:iron complex transport system substrate-binding protein
VRWLALLALVACSRSTATPVSEPKLVAVGGVVAEIVFALGEGKRVVAVDLTSTYPAEARALPKVGYQRQLAAEGILSLGPTMVIATSDAGPPATLDQLRQAGVEVVIVPAEPTREAARERITRIAALLGRPAEGKALVDDLDREADAAIAAAQATGTRPRVLFLYGRGGGTVMVSGTKTAASSILEMAHCDNPVTGYEGFKPLSGEAMIAAAPEVIVIPTRALEPLGGIDGVLALPGVAETPAGRARRIVDVDDALLLGFGPRLGEAISELAARVR